MSSLPAGIVTPEAVVLDFDTAGFASRLVAAVVDASMQAVALLFVSLAAFVVGVQSSWVAIVVLIVALFMVVFGYPIISESVFRGQTLGKKALGLRVVTVEGGPVRFRHSVVRAFLLLVDVLLVPVGVVGATAILISARNQRLGDMAAGTVVVRQHQAVGQTGAVWFAVPPGYDNYVASLDVGPVTSPQYEVVRRFLLRADTLSYGARHALGTRLAGEVGRRMNHLPPGHMPPELFLVCVAAGYQRRHAPAASVAAAPRPYPAPGSPLPPPSL
ncbi:MAG: RDD family protein [Acidimicrobiia bacterium]